jgi:hypothetical protein
MDYYGSTSCIANNGNQTVKINNATPPLTKVYATNSFGLCFNDEFSITTSNAKPSVDYAIYVGAPTSNNPASEPTIYSADYKLNLDQLTEKSTGNTSPVIVHLNTTTFKPTNNTIWWVPISTSIVGNYDATCYQMDYQNESYKVTYLNDIKITATEVCASSKVTLKFEGGAPEFISGKKYNEKFIIPEQKASHNYCCHAILFNKETVMNVINILTPLEKPIDLQLRSNFHKLRAYFLFPSMFFQNNDLFSYRRLFDGFDQLTNKSPNYVEKINIIE